MRVLFSALAISAMAAGASGAATLIGETVTIQQNFNGIVENPEDVVVGGGVEYTAKNGFFTVDISDMFIDIALGQNFGFAQIGSPNGPSIFDTFDAFGAFTSVTLVSDTFSGTPLASFTDNLIQFDFSSAGSSFGESARFAYTIASAAIPLPAALPLLAFALGGLALARRGRRTA